MKKAFAQRKVIPALLLAVLLVAGFGALYKNNYIPHRKYSGAHFGITGQVSDEKRFVHNKHLLSVPA